MEEIIESIEDIDLIDDNAKKEKEIIRLLKKVDKNLFKPFKYYYLRGYLWYQMPEQSEQRSKEIVYNFNKCIELNKDYLYANAYLAYFFFDSKEYIKVNELLQDLDLSYFEQEGQVWQSLKLEELCLVSQLYIDREIGNKLSEKLLSLISSYIHLPNIELAVPRELVTGVIENKDKKGMEIVLKNIYLMTSQSKQSVFFSHDLNNQLKRIIEK